MTRWQVNPEWTAAGERLRAILTDRKMSQQDFATAMGVDDARVSRWLNGQSEFDSNKLRKRACVILRCTEHDLDGTDDPPAVNAIRRLMAEVRRLLDALEKLLEGNRS